MIAVRIGILAFQGAFAEHARNLKSAHSELGETVNMEIVMVKRPGDLVGLAGLIIPGGESTTMSKFLEDDHFKDMLSDCLKGQNNKELVTWGTCAGLVLLANDVEGTKIDGQVTIGGLDISVTRNIYGRQKESFECDVTIKSEMLTGTNLSNKVYHGVFIRAPGITAINNNLVEVLAELRTSDTEICPVAVRQGNLLATTFHPELTNDYRWHRYFIRMVLQNTNQSMATK